MPKMLKEAWKKNFTMNSLLLELFTINNQFEQKIMDYYTNKYLWS